MREQKQINEKKFDTTFDDPQSQQAMDFEDNFDKTMVQNDVQLQEMDVLLTEKQQSLKKKIFSLAKMEALVHPDPRLSAIYDEMAENGEEKYGYHYNETIMNIIFNEYILNDAKYLEKYKQAIPKKKKRRDKSGINALKKDAEKIEQRRAEIKKERGIAEQDNAEFISKNSDAYGYANNMTPANQEIIKQDIKTGVMDKPNLKSTDLALQEDKVEINIDADDVMDAGPIAQQEKEIEESTSAGSAGGAAGYVGYAGPAAWSSQGDLSGDFKGKKKNKKVDPKAKPISKIMSIGESNYLTDPSGFEKYSKMLNENMDPTGKISTPEQYKAYVEQLKAVGKKLSKEDVPNIAGQALYNLAIKLADRLLPIASWNELDDTNSMWDHIDENGGMSLEELQRAVKEAVDERMSGAGFDMDMLGENNNVRVKGMDKLIASIELNNGVSRKLVDQIAQENGMEPTAVLRAIVDTVAKRELKRGLTSVQGTPLNLNEKAKSKAQQRFMGMVNAYKNGELDDADVSDEIERAADSMTDKEVDDFARTKHAGLPNRVNEDHLSDKEDMIKFIVAADKILYPNDPPTEDFVERSRALPFQKIQYFYEMFEEKLREKGIDPHTIEINENPALMALGTAAATGAGQAIGNRVADKVGLEEDHLDNREDKIKFIQKGVNKITGNQNLGYGSGWEDKTDDQVDMIYREVEKGLRGKGITPASINEKRLQRLTSSNLRTNEEKIPFIVNAIQKLGNSESVAQKYEKMLQTASDNVIHGMYVKAEKLLMEKGIDPSTLTETMIDNQEDSMKMGEPIGTQGGGDFPRGFQTGGGSMMENKNNNIMDENMKELEKINEDLEKLQKHHKGLTKTLNEVFSKERRIEMIRKIQDVNFNKDGGSMLSANYLNKLSDDELMKLYDDALKNDPETRMKMGRILGLDEDRKPSTLVMKDRLGNENEKNFKSDLSHSGTKEIIDITKELEWKDQQTDVGDDPQKLGMDIEKEVLKNTKGDAFENVGNSANNEGDEIPKRNLTTPEQDEVNLYRKGLGDYVFDNKPDERFEERMKRDMGDENYEMRQKRMEFNADAPMYNKDTQPMEDGIEKVQFDKAKSEWNERMGLKETALTGKYVDELGITRFFDFNTLNVQEVKDSKKGAFFKMDLTGLGNRYDSKVHMLESIEKAINEWTFYTDGKDIFAEKNPVQILTENEHKEETRPVNEQFNKMQHLLGYDPKKFTNTKNIKL